MPYIPFQTSANHYTYQLVPDKFFMPEHWILTVTLISVAKAEKSKYSQFDSLNSYFPNPKGPRAFFQNCQNIRGSPIKLETKPK